MYITEAHPSSGDSGGGGGKSGNEGKKVQIPQPKTDDERQKVATSCKSGLHLELPFVVDGIDNKVSGAYQAKPDRIYIVGKDGKITYQGGKGPLGFKSDDAEASLKGLLKS